MGEWQMRDVILSLQNIDMRFGAQEVLHNISLDVYRGEFITLLGPSGCGKTTTLRIVAGLERPQGGKIFLEGQDVTDLPPERRNVNTVFQNYALFPHMNVYRNIAYGLTLRGVKKDEIRTRVEEMLKLVQLEGYDKRMPDQLSGGQRQRVAIARAVINNPAILLLDEPLGALDLQLRRQLQVELKNLQMELGITFIYVTHDQEEALNMSSRIAVMNAGVFEQIGSPDDIYERPATEFAARFIGQSNILRGEVVSQGEDISRVRLSDGEIPVKGSYAQGDILVLSVRAERIDYAQDAAYGFALKGRIESHTYVGGVLRTIIKLHDDTELFITGANPTSQYPVGSDVAVFWDPETAAVVGEEAAHG